MRKAVSNKLPSSKQSNKKTLSLKQTLQESLTCITQNIKHQQNRQISIIHRTPKKSKNVQLNYLFKELNTSRDSDEQQKVWKKLKQKDGHYFDTNLLKDFKKKSKTRQYTISQQKQLPKQKKSYQTKLFWYATQKQKIQKSVSVSFLKTKQTKKLIHPEIRQTIGTASFVKLNQSGLTHAVLEELHPRLKNNYRLKIIDFSCNLLNNSAVAIIIDIIHYNQLTEINLRWNRITAQGAQILINSLANNIFLKQLDLSHNNLYSVSSSISDAFENFLSKNKKLIHLKLQECHINSEHCKRIVQSFNTKNKTIKGIHFKGNGNFYTNFMCFILKNPNESIVHQQPKLKLSSKIKYEKNIYKDCCWICQKWTEQTFTYSRYVPQAFDSELGDSFFIHLSCFNYQPLRMSPNPVKKLFEQLKNLRTKCQWMAQNYQITVAIPPNTPIYFFFSSKNSLYLSQNYPMINHRNTVIFTIDYHLHGYEDEMVTLELREKQYKAILEHINVIRNEDEQCLLNQSSFQQIIKIEPITFRQLDKKQREKSKTSKNIRMQDSNLETENIQIEYLKNVLPRNRELFLSSDIINQVNSFIQTKKKEANLVEHPQESVVSVNINNFTDSNFIQFQSPRISSYLSRCYSPKINANMTQCICILPVTQIITEGKSQISQVINEQAKSLIKSQKCKKQQIKTDFQLPKLNSIHQQHPKISFTQKFETQIPSIQPLLDINKNIIKGSQQYCFLSKISLFQHIQWLGNPQNQILNQYHNIILSYIRQPSILQNIFKSYENSSQRKKILNEILVTFNFSNTCNYMQDMIEKAIYSKIGQLKSIENLANVQRSRYSQGAKNQKVWKQFIKTITAPLKQDNINLKQDKNNVSSNLSKTLGRRKAGNQISQVLPTISQIQYHQENGINRWDWLFFEQQQQQHNSYNHFAKQVNLITEMIDKSIKFILNENEIADTTQLHSWLTKSCFTRLAFHLQGQIAKYRDNQNIGSIKNVYKQIIQSLILISVKELVKISILLSLKKKMSTVNSIIPRYDHLINQYTKKIVQVMKIFIHDEFSNTFQNKKIERQNKRVNSQFKREQSHNKNKFKNERSFSKIKIFRKQSRMMTVQIKKQDESKRPQSIINSSFNSVLNTFCQFWKQKHPESAIQQLLQPQIDLEHMKKVSPSRLGKKKKKRKITKQ